MTNSTKLNPYTNDPYINAQGKLEITSESQELMQRVDVLLHTRVGTIPYFPEYGIDYEWLSRQDIYNYNEAFFMELANRIDLGVEPYIETFDLDGIYIDGEMITIDITVHGKNTSVKTMVNV